MFQIVLKTVFRESACVPEHHDENFTVFLPQTHVDGAAQQRSSLQGLLDDLEQVGGGTLEVVVLSDATGEIFKSFSGGTARQCFIAAVHSVTKTQAEY